VFILKGVKLEANAESIKDWGIIASFLKAFAAILLGMDKIVSDSLIVLRNSGTTLTKESWGVIELKEFLKWGRARGQVTEEQHLVLSRLVSDSGWADVSDQWRAPDVPIASQYRQVGHKLN
jgi:hypothetical protein